MAQAPGGARAVSDEDIDSWLTLYAATGTGNNCAITLAGRLFDAALPRLPS